MRWQAEQRSKQVECWAISLPLDLSITPPHHAENQLFFSTSLLKDKESVVISASSVFSEVYLDAVFLPSLSRFSSLYHIVSRVGTPWKCLGQNHGWEISQGVSHCPGECSNVLSATIWTCSLFWHSLLDHTMNTVDRWLLGWPPLTQNLNSSSLRDAKTEFKIDLFWTPQYLHP